MWARIRFPVASTSAAATAFSAAIFGRERRNYGIARCERRQETFVTYNVLCNYLIHDGFRKRCSAADLESSVRLERVQKKLADVIARRGLIGLQEVSSDWAGEFYVFFARHGYQVVFAPYGEAFNGRMGVLFAYPTDRFVAENIRLHHVSSSLPETPSLAPITPPHLSEFGILSAVGMAQILGLHRDALDRNSRYAPRGPTVDVLNPRQDREWGLAERRQNVAVFARLRPSNGDKGAFCVGVYHMPCLFRGTEERQTQNIHILQLRTSLAKMAQKPEEPVILLGDFNIKPDGSAYSLLSGGALGHADCPDTERYRRIYTEFPLKSAHAAFHGTEPGPYQLDYIWMSDGCRVIDCPKLDPKIRGPSSTEPSDHLMVEAVLELPIESIGVPVGMNSDFKQYATSQSNARPAMSTHSTM